MPVNHDIYLPVSFTRMSTWPGLRPDTRACLHLVFARAASRAGGASLAERTLLVACEFWSAAASRSLVWYLGAEPAKRLRSLAKIYAAMSARQAVRVMGIAAGEIAGTANDQHCQRLIEALQDALLKRREIVDETINRFARRLVPLPPVRAPRSVVAIAATRQDRAVTVHLLAPHWSSTGQDLHAASPAVAS